MKNPVYEQIQARKVKARLHARSHPFSAIEMPRTARYCGLNTCYIARFFALTGKDSYADRYSNELAALCR